MIIILPGPHARCFCRGIQLKAVGLVQGHFGNVLRRRRKPRRPQHVSLAASRAFRPATLRRVGGLRDVPRRRRLLRGARGVGRPIRGAGRPIRGAAVRRGGGADAVPPRFRRPPRVPHSWPHPPRVPARPPLLAPPRFPRGSSIRVSNPSHRSNLSQQSESAIRVSNPSQQSESAIRVSNPSQRSESAIRVSNPSQRSESAIRVSDPSQRSKSTIRVSNPSRESP